MTARLVFVEQDGGLLRRDRHGDAQSPSIRLQPDCIGALTRFVDSGFGIVVLIDPAADSERRTPLAAEEQAFVVDLFDSQRIAFEAVERCSHVGSDCDCALPGIGLVADYLADSGLKRDQSIVVGCGPEVLALGRAMGIQAFDLDAGDGWSDVAHRVLDRPRRATVSRKTRETDIEVEIDLDRAAEPEIATGIGFFDHMLEQLGKHGAFALKVRCSGDLEIDEHHTVEDVALAIGQALREALGDKRGIARYGFLLPMDEAEAKVAIDLSGRACSVFEGSFTRESVGGLPTELVEHFFHSLAETLGAAIHISVRGENAHHMIEACFKGVARALRQAFVRAGRDLPSTKGSL